MDFNIDEIKNHVDESGKIIVDDTFTKAMKRFAEKVNSRGIPVDEAIAKVKERMIGFSDDNGYADADDFSDDQYNDEIEEEDVEVLNETEVGESNDNSEGIVEDSNFSTDDLNNFF